MTGHRRYSSPRRPAATVWPSGPREPAGSRTAVASRPGWHTCPRRGCDQQVPDRYFACRRCWFVLPADVRRAINGTSRLPLVNSRRAWAIRQAHHAWQEVDPCPPPQP